MISVRMVLRRSAVGSSSMFNCSPLSLISELSSPSSGLRMGLGVSSLSISISGFGGAVGVFGYQGAPPLTEGVRSTCRTIEIRSVWLFSWLECQGLPGGLLDLCMPW